VRDVINGACHQPNIKCLEQRKSDSSVQTAEENLEGKL